MFTEQLKKTYFNILIKPEKLGKYVCFLVAMRVITKCMLPSSGEMYDRPKQKSLQPSTSPFYLLFHIPFFLSSRDVRLLILEHSRWSMVDKYEALTAGLTTKELLEFSQSFRAELYAEGLVQGNFSNAVSGQQSAHRQGGWLTIILADWNKSVNAHVYTCISCFWVHLTLPSCLADCLSSRSFSLISHYSLLFIVFPPQESVQFLQYVTE